ncbi:3-mercaptopyruvate sulfurtransferase [Phenylobacterium sp.]|jgi:thiosulfate/3-mercaptopyruvate sulfurtransferase|uniref:3-mercaptopyruvate sulfurtransferase n=1 Tax=Phenylobacterium sp. TaxID=1871053 RepID=UPI002F95D8DA
MTSPLVSTEWLAARLGEVQVVDATWFMPGEGVGRESYEAGHIPGAVFFDIDDLSDKAVDLPHMLPAPAAFAEAAGALGLTRERPVVVYDAHGIFSAPRAWWTLRVMGFPEVFVLDGGLKTWRAEARPVETGPGAPRPAALEPAFRPELVRDVEQVRDALAGAAQVVDARAAARFRGEAPEPRAGLRSGHMPGARNVPWSGLVAADGTLKPSGELRQAFTAAGVDLNRPVVTTCGSGVSAAILSLALTQLGCADAPVYDGSWAEWGGRADTPVATGD